MLVRKLDLSRLAAPGMSALDTDQRVKVAEAMRARCIVCPETSEAEANLFIQTRAGGPWLVGPGG